MKDIYSQNLLIRGIISLIFLCIFERRLISVDSTDNQLKSLTKLDENQLLYRKRYSSYYLYSNEDQLEEEQRIHNRKFGREANYGHKRWQTSEPLISPEEPKYPIEVSRRTSEPLISPEEPKNKPKVTQRVPDVWNQGWKKTNNEAKPWLKPNAVALPEGVAEDQSKSEEKISIRSLIGKFRASRKDKARASRKRTTRAATLKIGDQSVESNLFNLSVPNCGISTSMAIVNGKDAADGAYPWIALIFRRGDPFCSGTIINEEWIVSASHCFQDPAYSNPDNFKIRVGSNNREKGTDYNVIKVITNEKFSNSELSSDISMLKIAGPIKMNRNVMPACLPSHPLAEPKSEYVMVTGWGSVSYGGNDMPIQLQEVRLKLTTIQHCSEKYKTESQPVFKSQFCTWNQDQDACQGDSGGPAIEYINGRGTLVGVVSYGATCADSFPGVFTKVSYFLHWIQEKMNNN